MEEVGIRRLTGFGVMPGSLLTPGNLLNCPESAPALIAEMNAKHSTHASINYSRLYKAIDNSQKRQIIMRFLSASYVEFSRIPRCMNPSPSF